MPKKNLIDKLPHPIELDLFDAYDMHYRFETKDPNKVKLILNELLTWTTKKLNVCPVSVEVSELKDALDATLYFKNINEMLAFRTNPVVNIYAKRKTQPLPQDAGREISANP